MHFTIFLILNLACPRPVRIPKPEPKPEPCLYSNLYVILPSTYPLLAAFILLATFYLYEIIKYVFEERGHRTFVHCSDISAHCSQ